ncbi:thiamine pyrophosphate-dependent dehydrogenase E1 component subunit alpha [Candidatus Bathyarchaeota archaeon]|nr:thiamine pyrophosphate-dependent dehydrogenase E1 component subunit alpha [Candidatus Bathyarchaeota archaeon]
MKQPLSSSISPELLLKMYVTMVKIRKFEERVADLVISKEIVTPTHLYIGEEAVATGVCSTLKKQDYVFSTHRSHGHYLAKGGDLKALMAELYCKKTGCSRGKGGSMHVASPEMGLPGSSAIVGGTIPIAVGAALAFSMQNSDAISAAFFGDGAAHEGVFYESLNFASLKKLPVIFVCENNLYCTHLSVVDTLADTNIYKKAEAFAMPGVRIDGNDISEVYETAKRAVENARQSRGPTLIEAMTYRWRGHVGPYDDLDKGLRSKEELDCWMQRCPVRKLEKHLLKQGATSQLEINQIHKTISEEIEKAVEFARESPYPDENDLLHDVHK